MSLENPAYNHSYQFLPNLEGSENWPVHTQCFKEAARKERRWPLSTRPGYRAEPSHVGPPRSNKHWNVGYIFQKSYRELQTGRGQEVAALNSFYNIPSNSVLTWTSTSHSAHQLTASILLRRQFRKHPLALETKQPNPSNYTLDFVLSRVVVPRHHLPFTPSAIYMSLPDWCPNDLPCCPPLTPL